MENSQEEPRRPSALDLLKRQADTQPIRESPEVVRNCLELLSGRAHRVMTAICVLAPDGRQGRRLVETRVHFKRLTKPDIDRYLDSGEGLGKAGGYAIQGRAAAFAVFISGSYSNVVGLPLFETAALLRSAQRPTLGSAPRSA